MKIDQLFSTETAGRFFVRIVISNRKNRQIDSGKLKVWFYKVYNPVENHGRFGNASQIRSANFDRIQKSGDFCAILYVGIAEEDVIVETQAFDPLRVKATPTGRKRASVPAGKSEPAFVFP